MKNLAEYFDKELRQRLQGFSKILNVYPKKEEVKENPFANKAKYLPISFIEMELDEIFFGLWQTENFKSQIVVNEIIGQIDLLVYHPVLKEWIRRTGNGSTPIQMQKGSGVTEVAKKIHNTLVKDYPHLKTECIKNAAKSFGKRFGRDLNRHFEDTYIPLLKMPEDDPSTIGQSNLIESLLLTSGLDDKEQTAIFNEMNDYNFNQAAQCIEYIQRNQQVYIETDINRPNHLGPTESTKAFEDKMNDPKS